MPSSLIPRLRSGMDPASAEPLSRQLVEQLWAEVIEGRLPTGERLPTVRQMAIELGLNPRSVQRAYRELGRLGVVATRPGKGTFVSLHPPREEERARRREFVRMCRRAVDEARALGFGVNDLLDEIREFRDTGGDEAGSDPPGPLPGPEETP